MENNENMENGFVPEQAAPQNVIWGEPAAETQPVETVAPQPPKKKGKKLLLWGGIVAAVLALAAVAYFFLSNTYKTPVKTLEQLENTKKVIAPYDIYAKQLNGFCESEFKAMIKIAKKAEDYEEELEDYEENFKENLEKKKEDYGDNFKVTYKITDKEEIDKDDLKEFKNNVHEKGKSVINYIDELDSDEYEEIADEMGLTKAQVKDMAKQMEKIGKKLKSAKVTEGYTLTIEVTTTGSELDEPIEEEIELKVYKIDGRWVSSTAVAILAAYSSF